MKRLILSLFTLVILLPFTAFGQIPQKIEKLLNSYEKNGQLNGTVLVAKNDQIIYQKGHGFANMEWDIRNSPDTRFRIGSVTKQMTALMTLQLVQEGKLKLDGKITDYLPDYRKDTGDKVTIHQLLNHTSGIPSYTSDEFLQKHVRKSFEPKSFVKRFASGDFEFKPGSKYEYNNSGYFILGVIIEESNR